MAVSPRDPEGRVRRIKMPAAGVGAAAGMGADPGTTPRAKPSTRYMTRIPLEFRSHAGFALPLRVPARGTFDTSSPCAPEQGWRATRPSRRRIPAGERRSPRSGARPSPGSERTRNPQPRRFLLQVRERCLRVLGSSRSVSSDASICDLSHEGGVFHWQVRFGWALRSHNANRVGQGFEFGVSNRSRL